MRVIEALISLQSLYKEDSEDYRRIVGSLEPSSVCDPLLLECLKTHQVFLYLPILEKLQDIFYNEPKATQAFFSESNGSFSLSVFNEIIRHHLFTTHHPDVSSVSIRLLNLYARYSPEIINQLLVKGPKQTIEYLKTAEGPLGVLANSEPIQRVRAVLMIQKTWRGLKERRNLAKMLRGFLALQQLFLSRRSAKEVLSELRVFDESDASFFIKYDKLIGRRRGYEGRYVTLASLPPKKFKDFERLEQDRAAHQIQQFWRCIKYKKIDSEIDEIRKRDAAARVIQKYAGKWLLSRQNKAQWSHSLLAREPLSHDRIQKIQREIDISLSSIGGEAKAQGRDLAGGQVVQV